MTGTTRTVKILCSFAALLIVEACSHPIQIFGEGDVLSASGTRNCLLEDYQSGHPNCSENLVETNYNETYSAVARTGYQFRRWANYCTKALTNECSFNVAAPLVQSFWNLTVPPLRAVFRPTTNTGFNTLFMGDGLFGPIADGMAAHASLAGFGDHSQMLIVGSGIAGTPQALWDDPAQRAIIKGELDGGAVELVGMTFSPAYPAVANYKKWVDYALKKNPDTRFFIAAPWSDNPQGLDNVEFENAYLATHALIHALIDALRAAYPGVDFYDIPSGQGAVDLYNLHAAANLPDVSALVGGSTDAIFTDGAGAPGDILIALGQLVWLSAIYDVDLSAYTGDPGYITDIKLLAQLIDDGHDTGYNAPPEIYVDADGDGVYDHVDPDPTGKPNVLLIVADDLGYNDLAINNGNTEIDTPNMDQIAQDGVRFTRHYAAAVCSPARASLLTGLYPERLGYTPASPGISAEVVTLPDHLREAGYTTWHIGKWHMGDLERRAWPDYQGFDHWFGFLNQWRLAGVHVNGELQLANPTYIDPWLEGNNAPGAIYPGHLETILTDKTIDVLDDLHAAHAPWFLNLWYFAPHGPVTPAAEFAALYPDTDAGRYQALVNQLDFNIGRVVSHLDALGELDNTIVIIVSDNGGTNAAINSNAPYFGTKNTVTEGGLRTPLIIQWPDAALNEQVIEDTVSIEDIFPTLVDYIGIATPANLDGNSFLPRIQQLEPLAQKDLFWEHGVTYGALTADGRWRLYQPAPYLGVPLQPKLYDFVDDPYGSWFVVPTPPLQLAQMTQDYEAWFRDVHRVAAVYSGQPNGSGVVTGMEFLRTPGQGEYTFGIGIPDDLDGQIAGQTGIWNLSRSGDTITAQFGGYYLAGDITSSDTCHSIVISGVFKRLTLISGTDHFDLTLYIDGQAVQSIAMDDGLDIADITVDTIIGDPLQAPGGSVPLQPVILTTTLDSYSPWTLASLTQELCTGP